MPEFHLDLGDARKQFAEIDSFTQGYIEAAFFTECHSDNPDLEHATFADLAPESLATAIAECRAFQDANAALLESVYGAQCRYEQVPYDESRAGSDYWYTRNGHGTGFWDRGLGEPGDALANAAHYSERHMYCDDDGRVYIE